MDIIDIIVSPLSGAVIGYFTNWLAIKMLFRPYKEKFLFGIKLPFTPGLIPKERFDLSAKVGETLSKNVLTNEVLIKSISKPEMMEQLSSIINSAIESMAASDKTIGEIMTLALKDGQNSAVSLAKTKITEYVSSLAENDKIAEEISSLIVAKLAEVLKSPANYFPVNEIYENAKAFALDKGVPYLKSEEFTALLDKFTTDILLRISADGKRVNDIIPSELSEGVKNAVAAHIIDMRGFVESFLDSNPILEEKLRQLVAKIAAENFGSFIGIFIKYDNLYDSIKQNIFEYLANEENQEYISIQISNYIDDFMSKDISRLTDKIPYEARQKFIFNATGIIKDKLSDEFTNGAFTFVESKKDKLYELDLYSVALKIDQNFEQKTALSIQKNILPSAMQELAKRMPDLLDKMLESLMNKKISDIFVGISAESKAKLNAFVMEAVQTAIGKGGAYVINSLNISKIVEEKLNEFEVDEAEKIIVGVVDRELKMITWLGGVLGLIIGFVPLFVDLIR